MVPDSDDRTTEEFVEKNAYKTHKLQPIPEPADNEPQFAITNSKRGVVREMVEFKFSQNCARFAFNNHKAKSWLHKSTSQSYFYLYTYNL